MKKIIFGLVLFLITSSVQARILPFEITSYQGYRIFRDSQDSRLFYYLPRYMFVQQDRNNRLRMSHTFFHRATPSFSLYNFVVSCVPPTDTLLEDIALELSYREKINNARLEPAPISDIYFHSPDLLEAAYPAQAIKFVLSDWQDREFQSVADLYQPMSLQFHVHEMMEPNMSEALMQGAGIKLPSVKIKFKGQFTPKKAFLRYNSKKVHNYFSASVGGIYKIFSWNLTQEIETLKRERALELDVECDLPNPDQNAECNSSLEKQLIDMFKELKFNEVANHVTMQPGDIPTNIIGLVYKGSSVSEEETVTLKFNHTSHNYFYYDIETIVSNIPRGMFDSRIFNLENK